MTYTRALAYRDRDRLATIPLPHGSKEPECGFNLRRWLSRATLPAEHHLSRLFNGHPQNIAGVMGPPSLGAFALDCDTPTAFTDTGHRLVGLGIETRTIRRPMNGSDHDGGGTYLFRAPTAVRTAGRGDLEVRGKGAYILLPSSLHPSGGVYYDNAVTIFELPDLRALDWLELEPAPDTPNLPKSALVLLAGDQEAIARYASRSEAEHAICCALANAGFTFHQALNLFTSWTGPGKFREMNDKDRDAARRYLSLTWHNAESFVTSHPSEHKTLAQDLVTWALSRPWPGRTGSTDRAVYLAHLEIVQRCASQPHGASVRELGELAGVHWQTAARANHRLVNASLLELVELATVSRPHRWRLIDPDVPSRYTPSQSVPTRECSSMAHSDGHDLGRWQGLNKASLEVVRALMTCDDWTAMVTELADLTGRGRRTIYRKLKGSPRDNGDVSPGLFHLGLVEPVGRGTWRLVPEYTDTMLDDAAEYLGVAGLGDRQRHRHRQDRTGHRIELERGAL